MGTTFQSMTYTIYRLAPDRRYVEGVMDKAHALSKARHLAMGQQKGVMVEVWENPPDKVGYPIYGAEKLDRGLSERFREDETPVKPAETKPAKAPGRRDRMRAAIAAALKEADRTIKGPTDMHAMVFEETSWSFDHQTEADQMIERMIDVALTVYGKD